MTAWAFVVGINAYDEEVNGLEPLNGAVADAADFAQWALEPTGGGVAPEHLFLWTCEAPSNPGPDLKPYLDAGAKWPTMPPDFSRAPKASEINAAVDLVACNAAKSGADRLYVFLAGHGAQTRSKEFDDEVQQCFLAGDFTLGMMSTGIVPCTHLERMLVKLGPPEIVMLLDMCRSKAPPQLPKPGAPWNIRPDNGLHRRMAIGRAAQAKAVAYEVPHDDPSRGAFTQLVVEGLRQHRVEGKLMVHDLDDYVSRAIPALVAPYAQFPAIVELPRPPGIVLALGASVQPPPVLKLQFTSRPAGEQLLLVGGPSNVEIEVTVADEVVAIPAEPGAYVLETHDGEELARITHVGTGDSDVEI